MPTPRKRRPTGATHLARGGGGLSSTASGSGDPDASSSVLASAITTARSATGITVEADGPLSPSDPPVPATATSSLAQPKLRHINGSVTTTPCTRGSVTVWVLLSNSPRRTCSPFG